MCVTIVCHYNCYYKLLLRITNKLSRYNFIRGFDLLNFYWLYKEYMYIRNRF